MRAIRARLRPVARRVRQRTAGRRRARAGRASPPDTVARHEVLAATTREPAAGGDMFSSRRASEAAVGYARVVVGVPPAREAGYVQWPGSAPGDPTESFTTVDRDYLDAAAFRTRLDAALEARAPQDRDVLLFVHGFNTRFDEAVYRIAQFVHDGGYKGVPVVFSFASAGSVFGYLYDRDSAILSRDGLEATMRALSADPDVRRIHVLCHSMGCLLTMETLRQAKIAGDATFGGKLGDVVLAAPDIDVSLFRAQLARLGGRMPSPTAIFVSRDDGALGLSSRLARGEARLGDFAEASSFASAGIAVVDISDVAAGQTALMGHDKVFASVGLARLVGTELGRGSRLGKNAPEAGDELATDLRRVGLALGDSLGSVIDVFLPGSASP